MDGVKPLTDAQIAELEMLYKEATPGEHLYLGQNGSTQVENFCVIGNPNHAATAYVANRGDADLYCAARTALPALLAEVRAARQEWIPVTERLPEMETAVWVWADGGPMVAMRSDPEHEGWLWYFAQEAWSLIDGDYEMADYNVTYWRPLPSAPPEPK